MDQFCLVVPILPSRTADARDFRRELEAGPNADYRRVVFVSTVRQRPLHVCSRAQGLSLRGWLGRGLRPAVNHRCPGRAAGAGTYRGGRSSSSEPMAVLAANGHGEAPVIGAGMGPRAVARRTMPNGEVGDAGDW